MTLDFASVHYNQAAQPGIGADERRQAGARGSMPKTLGRSVAMTPRTKTALWVVGILVLLVGATLALAVVWVRVGLGQTAASFLAAANVACLLGLYGGLYQFWARRFWGAPFEVGDRVRIVSGLGAGSEATVVGLGQGVEVEIEFDDAGHPQRRRLCWGGLRRVVSGRPN